MRLPPIGYTKFIWNRCLVSSTQIEGEACQNYSCLFRKPSDYSLDIKNANGIDAALARWVHAEMLM